MPKAALNQGQAYDLPPESIQKLSPELYDYLTAIHVRTFGTQGGKGDLDSDNINGELTDTTDHALLINVTKFQHHGTGNHDSLDQSAASVDATASTVVVSSPDATSSTVSITSADADLAYSINERDLINELKTDVNILVTDFNKGNVLSTELKADVNTIVTDLNLIKDSLNDLKTKMRTAKLLT